MNLDVGPTRVAGEWFEDIRSQISSFSTSHAVYAETTFAAGNLLFATGEARTEQSANSVTVVLIMARGKIARSRSALAGFESDIQKRSNWGSWRLWCGKSHWVDLAGLAGETVVVSQNRDVNGNALKWRSSLEHLLQTAYCSG